MRIIQFLGIVALAGLVATSAWAGRGVTELGEGTIRTVYIDAPHVGAKGYVVADMEKGQVRVEAVKFPVSDAGYEVFLFEIDIPAFMSKMFVDGVKDKGVVANPPPMGEVAGLISQWYSLGDLQMDKDGSGILISDSGKNLHDTGLNMIMIFEKVSAGRHDGPEDMSKLMVECNGPLMGAKGIDGMEMSITVLPEI
jgi:hypothetical protein